MTEIANSVETKNLTRILEEDDKEAKTRSVAEGEKVQHDKNPCLSS